MTEPTPETRPLERREQQAISLMQVGALPQAEAIFLDVLSDRPHDHQIMNTLAILAAQLGRTRRGAERSAESPHPPSGKLLPRRRFRPDRPLGGR
jgi:Flp pilus assembly protein TadD